MFSLNKTVVCLEFSKNSVFCALAQIAGRKVDIIAIDSIQIDSGILEEGIIYDTPHLQHVVKNLVTSVSKTHNEIDAAWVSIPDNKVLITKFEVEKDKKGIDEDEIHKAIEEKFNYSASKLYLINRPIHELNKKVFFLSNAVRIDNLEPFLQLFDPLNIPVEAVFPTFQCLFEETKDQFSVPTLVLYPNKKGFKFFVADTNGVYLESVWGHNVIEFNENFDKAIKEVIQYTKQSKEVALGIKKIAIIETTDFHHEVLQEYLQKIGIEWSWIASGGSSDDEFDPISIMVLKGLIKACMAKTFNKGFLEPQITHLENANNFAAPASKAPALITPLQTNTHEDLEAPAYTTTTSKNTVIRDSSDEVNRWSLKSIIATVLIGLTLLGLMFYIGAKLANTTSRQTNNTNNQQLVATPTPEIIATATSTPSPSPTPSVKPLTKQEVKVQVFNGNNVAGEAARVNGILNSKGFQTLTPANTTPVGSTTVVYKNAGAKDLAEEIVKLLEPS